MKSWFLLFLKGLAMGAANVIPGVSGGTIAFITGIYQPFIDALKSFDLSAVRLLFQFRFREFATHINLGFLFVLGLGILASLLSLGRLLDILFTGYPVYVWSFFFGLIAISVISVGKTIQSYNAINLFWGLLGTGIAAALALLNPASENTGAIYLIICGMVAIASMILPGLSGSFVLILLGNYRLIMLHAIPELKWEILVPVGIGAVAGFVLLSRIISFMLKRFFNQVVSLLTGFILGSLLVIWPWKKELLMQDASGTLLLKDGEPLVSGYEWFMPSFGHETIIAAGFMLSGILIVLLIERLAKRSDA